MTNSISILRITMATIVAVSLAACGNGKKPGKEEISKAEQTENPASNEETSVTTPLLNAYLAIKDALVNDDKDAAATAGNKLAGHIEVFDANGFTEAQQQELKGIIETVKEHSAHIAKSDISQQREHFLILGKNIKKLVSIAGTDRTLYQQYCPMYNDNQGGMWLSASQEIRNPYFGSSMLKCGRVQQEINTK